MIRKCSDTVESLDMLVGLSTGLQCSKAKGEGRKAGKDLRRNPTAKRRETLVQNRPNFDIFRCERLVTSLFFNPEP